MSLEGRKQIREAKRVSAMLMGFAATTGLVMGLMTTTVAHAQSKTPSNSTTQMSRSDVDPDYATYKVSKDVTLPIQKLENGAASNENTSLALKAGTELTVLDVSHDASLGDLVRLGLDADPKAGVPSDFWVRANDLIAAELQELNIVTNDRDPLDGSDRAMSARTRLSGHAKKGGKKPMTYCYHYVKEYLLQHKIVPVYLPGNSAYQAASILPEYGLHRVARNQTDAKIGDICVYKGGNGDNGHIEVKRPEGWWYGYGFKQQSISTTDHRLVGCYSK